MSLQHAAVVGFLRASGRHRPWRGAEALDRAIARRDPWPAPPPAPAPGVPVALRDDEDLRIVRLGADRGRGRGTVLALHGGAYVFGPSPQHWTLWRTIARRSGRTVVAPLYRLAPEGTAATTVPHVARIAARLAAEEGPLALLGDSAGGGLALAVAQVLREQGIRPPILLSAPWLDAGMTQPWVLDRDPWLAVPGFRRAANLYRGDLPLDHPFVSPLLGDLADLGPITVSTGTRDVLHGDALRLEALAPPSTPVRVLTARGVVHNPPLLPVPEARPAIRAFVDALR